VPGLVRPTVAPVAVESSAAAHARSPEGGDARGPKPHLSGLFRGALPFNKNSRSQVLLTQLAIVGCFLVLWQLAAGQPRQGALLDELFVGKPTLIWQQTVRWSLDGTLVSNAWVTVQEAMLGFALGGASGIVIGLIFGATHVGRTVFAPLVFFAYSVPRLALAPLFILWFGIGMESKVALVTVIVFFYVFFNAYEGAQQVDDALTAVCRMMKASPLQILVKVTLPSALTWVALGLKVSLPHAFAGAVVGEIIAGRTGLGTLMSRSSHALDANGLFSAAVVTAVLVVVLNAVVGRVIGFGQHWRQAGSSGGTELL
jgi:NitT/TauT family transport system permease protein